jgi:hypothetical protein
MRTILGLCIISCVVFGGCQCQKPVTDTGTILAKIITPNGAGGMDTTYYSYYGNGFLKRIQVNFSGGGSRINYDITRNSNGIITQYSDFGTGNSIVYYNAALGQYTYSIKTITGTTTVIDSTVYLYSGGLITEAITYGKDISNNTYALSFKRSYTYDGAENVTQVIMYTYISGAWHTLESYSFTYDNRLNPLSLYINGGVVLWLPSLEQAIGPNNIAMSNYENFDAPSMNHITTHTYTYNPNGTPATCDGSTYYYQ